MDAERTLHRTGAGAHAGDILICVEDVQVRIPGVRETRTHAALEEVRSATRLPL